MSRAKLLAAILVGTAFVGEAFVMSGSAQTPAHSALTGKVSSDADGALEGVLIGAKKAGATIATWVVSNAQGEYSFPRDRMDPGKYALTVRAAGYELPHSSVDVTAHSTNLDLRLKKVTSPTKLAMQLSNGELIMSVPGTQAQKVALGACVNCHTLQRVLFSRFNALEMTPVVQRMARHTNNSSPMHPWMRPAEGHPVPPPTEPSNVATYFSSINLSERDTFEFPLKTLPRPKGKGTQVIYTVYDLPRADASPHDIVFDAEGNAWYSDFNSQFLGRLDPKTGNVVEYEIPLSRLRQNAHGGLQIDIDKEGRIYYGNMFQMQLARLDPKTGKMDTFKHPMAESTFGDGHLTMIDPAFQHLDGRIDADVGIAEFPVDPVRGGEDALAFAAGHDIAQQRDDAKQAVQPIDRHDGALQLRPVGPDIEQAFHRQAKRRAGCADVLEPDLLQRLFPAELSGQLGEVDAAAFHQFGEAGG